MSFSVGADIEQVSRFRRKPYRLHREFYEKVFSRDELAYCLSRPDPFPHFAARFAAKEALIKAVPSLMTAALSAIEVVRGAHSLSVRVRKKGVNAKKIALSISHSGDYALAFVVYGGSG